MTKEKAIKDYSDLVYQISNKFFIRDQHQRDDLNQAGMLGLIKCVETFDPKKNISFSTYCYRPIMWAIMQELKRQQNNLSQIDTEELNIPDVKSKSNKSVFYDIMELDSKQMQIGYRRFVDRESIRSLSTEFNMTRRKMKDYLSKLEQAFSSLKDEN